jgi:parallel beta helix pectate lyase-like protein
MPHLQLTFSCLGIAALFLVASVSGSAGAAHAPTGQGAGRVLHVSQAQFSKLAPAHQFRTIGEAARAVEAGDTVLIHTGVYREAVVVERSGTAARPIRFEAAPAAAVVVTGADRLTGWKREGSEGESLYSIPWPYSFINWNPETHTHPDDAYHRVIGRAEQVFAAGYPLHQVLRREEMGRGTFFADLKAKRLYVRTAPDTDLMGEDILVEGSVRPLLWETRGQYIHLRGLRFRYAANAAQHGAVQLKGRGNVVEDCIFERANSIGASFLAPEQVARRCTFADNGQMGFSAVRAHDLLVTGCVVRNNNTKGFSRGWEAGGNKIVLCRGTVLEKTRFIENRGSGIWFDIGNEDCTVRNCLIADNEDAGIFYEISYGLRAHDNVITGNGFAQTAGAWGAQAGISLSSSPGCRIERNILAGNREGLNFREQGRRTPRLGQAEGAAEEWVWTHDQVVRKNLIAYNRDAQTWGWFDVRDERHWPAALQVTGGRGEGADPGKTPADIAAEYQARQKTGEPTGLTLEKLNLRLAENLYVVEEGQGLFHWGTTWRRHQRYASLEAVRRELKLEQGSLEAPPVFADYAARDFRVPPGSPALKMGCYPRGEVPGVLLGVWKPGVPSEQPGVLDGALRPALRRTSSSPSILPIPAGSCSARASCRRRTSPE